PEGEEEPRRERAHREAHHTAASKRDPGRGGKRERPDDGGIRRLTFLDRDEGEALAREPLHASCGPGRREPHRLERPRDAPWKIAYPLDHVARLRAAVGFVLSEKVGHTRNARVHLAAAQLLGAHLLSRRGRDERRPREEDRAAVLHDDALV